MKRRRKKKNLFILHCSYLKGIGVLSGVSGEEGGGMVGIYLVRGIHLS
jgi:hypothetical protein